MNSIYLKKIICLLFCFANVSSYSQTSENSVFANVIDSAMFAYEKKEYKEAASLYLKAAVIGRKNHPWERYAEYYYAACAFSMYEQKDSAFIYLSKAIDEGFTSKKGIFEEPDLKELFKDSIPLNLIKQKVAIKQIQKDEFLTIRKTLEKFEIEDQAAVNNFSNIQSNTTTDSSDFYKASKKCDDINKLQIAFLNNIFDSIGFIGVDLIGIEASTSIFLIIQHSKDIKMQEKFYNIFEKASADGKYPASSLAFILS